MCASSFFNAIYVIIPPIKEKVVTFLGRITFQKGPEYFIETAYKVLQKDRNIRFVTNSTFPNGASDKVRITAQPGETIDGNAFFEISKVYEGVSIWSNGTEWIIIQAKAH